MGCKVLYEARSKYWTNLLRKIASASFFGPMDCFDLANHSERQGIVSG